MSFVIENLSLKSLEKIFLVLDDIKYNIEIQNKTKWLNMGQLQGIDGVPKFEYMQIIHSLENEGVIDHVPYTIGDYCLEVHMDKFNAFFQKVLAQIDILKNEQAIYSGSANKAIYFDNSESVLSVGDYKIKISLRDKKTVAHDILEYIFIENRENLADDFYYSEMAYDKFKDYGYTKDSNAWKTYYAACLDIQDKMRKQTTNEIEDFLIYNASPQGRVKINPKYLP